MVWTHSNSIQFLSPFYGNAAYYFQNESKCFIDKKEAVNNEEEELFWSKGLFGQSSARSLLNTVYFCYGKLFGLRASEHRSITLLNIRVLDDFIKFEENV